MRDNGMSRCIDIQGLAPKPASGAIVPPTPATRIPARFLRPFPTVRRLDARQRYVPLHRHSGPCPETLRRSAAPAPRIMTALTATPAAELELLGEFLPETIHWLEPAAPKKPNRRRRHVERFRTDDEEHAELERRARDAGLTVHAYCRMRTLGDPGPRARRRAPVDATALTQGLVAFNRQHSNYNQAIRALNTLALVADNDGTGNVLRAVRELQAVIERLQEQFAAPVAAILDAMRHDREG
jgi:hypothetical protein